MILAAGRGERLRPLSDHTPKPLLEVAGRPLIFHHLEALSRAGVSDIVINLHHLADKIRSAVGDGTRFGVKVQYSFEAALLETGGGITQALPLLGDAPFLLVNADIYTDYNLAQFPQTLPPGSLAHLLLTPTPAFRDTGDFDLTDGIITSRGNSYVYCCIALIDPKLFEGRNPEPFSWTRDLLFARLHERIASATIHRGFWTDIGNLAQLEDLRERLSLQTR
ncbi:MAG: nucleotidyltransferase family protein [Proteobacteria bacterium]|nr:nucleotidyltransferase family protein [Pseudomonadota bacterium]